MPRSLSLSLYVLCAMKKFFCSICVLMFLALVSNMIQIIVVDEHYMHGKLQLFNNFALSLWSLFLGDDLLEFHQAVVSTLRDADEMPIPLDPAPVNMNIPHSMMMPQMQDRHTDDLGRISDNINTDQPIDPEDELDPSQSSKFVKIINF